MNIYRAGAIATGIIGTIAMAQNRIFNAAVFLPAFVILDILGNKRETKERQQPPATEQESDGTAT